MKIAILSSFYPFRGGISQFNTYLLKELSKKHTVKAFNFSRQYPSFLFPGKTQLVAKDDDASPVESVAILDKANPLNWGSAARNIEEWGPDLLITRYWMSYFAPSLGKVSSKLKKRGVKCISIMDNVLPHERHFFDAPLAKYFISKQDGIITLSKAVEEDLKKINPDKKSVVIPHPLYSNFGERMDTLQARKELGIKGTDEEIMKRKVLLFFGLIRPYKGLDILLEAMTHLDDSYTLVVAGETYGSFDYCTKIIESEPFARCKKNLLIFNRFIPDGEVKRYFSAADVCVLPYRSATQSGISSISWSFNLPMITTPVGGLVESIGGKGTGLLTKEVSAESVAEAIEEYFKEGKKELYVSNIEALKKELSWETFAEKLEQFAKTL